MAMVADMMSSPEIIEALGGYRKVAAIFDVPPPVAHKWLKRGIPARYWTEAIAYAAENSIPGITADALRGPMAQRARSDAVLV